MNNIDNILNLAEQKMKIKEFDEAIDLIDEAIKIDETYYMAWILKGKAIKGSNNYIEDYADAIEAFRNAIEYCPIDKKKAVEKECVDLVIKYLKAILISGCEELEYRISKYDSRALLDFQMSQFNFNKYIIAFMDHIENVYDINKVNENFDTIISNECYESSKAVFDKQFKFYINKLNKYKGKNIIYYDQYNIYDLVNNPDNPLQLKNECQTLLKLGDSCKELLTYSISKAKNDTKKIDKMKYYISINDRLKNLKYYDKPIYGYDYTSRYDSQKLELQDYFDGLMIMRLEDDNSPYESEIKRYEKELKDKEKALEKERVEKYWAEHPNDKKMLESKKNDLELEIKNLNNKIINIKENRRAPKLLDQIEQLRAEIRNLGIFKFAEKKKREELIQKLNNDINEESKTIESKVKSINIQIDNCKLRIEDIEKELTSGRK